MVALTGIEPVNSQFSSVHFGLLTGQSLLRADRNSNECNWSTARKKIGPVNRPCDRPIDVISIASLMFLVTSRLADQRRKRKWRNWQTHSLEVAAPAREWGFRSPLPHQKPQRRLWIL